MSKKFDRQTRLNDALGTRFIVSLKPLKWFSALVAAALLLAWCPAQAEQQPDDQYLRIYGLIQQADSLSTSNQMVQALAKYQQAQTALQNFQKGYPAWNAKVVAFRLDYLAGRIAALSEKAPATAANAPAGDKSETSSEAKTAAPASGLQIKVLDAGAEPRKVLRLHPKPGDKQKLNMTIKMAMDIKMGEMQNPAMSLPTMKLTVDTTVKNVTADGDITYEMIMSEAGVAEEPGAAPQLVAAMKASFAGVKGMSGAGTISSRGLNKGTEMKAPSGADAQAGQVVDQMKEAFSDLAVRLPEEAVGPGAKWEVRMPRKSQGMMIDQTDTYQLVSIEGERLTAKTTVSQRASNQKVQNAAMPGLKLDLIKMTGKGSGDITLDLTQLFPSKGTTDLHSEQSMSMNAGGQKQTMTMKLDLKGSLEAK